MPFLFVYGTLKLGFSNHEVLAGAEYLGEASTQGQLYAVGRAFPAMALSGRAADRVHGELYRVKDFDATDALEGYDADHREDSHYLRTSVQVRIVDGGQPYDAETYIYNRPVLWLDPIPSGRWEE